MEVIADLHIHSRFSRACSTALNIETLEKWARIKGVGLLGSGDFTHPRWLSELKENLKEDDSGVLWTKTGFPFVLQGEISLMYSQGGKGRKIHLVLLAPSFKVVEKINQALLKIGRLDYDGRPIFGLPAPEFVNLLKSISDQIEIIPAHVWTPWFGLFGSKSGFDSVEECFGNQTKHIFALETGLSSDPAMNWRLSGLDRYQLVSNSDSHSFWPWRLAREANVFEFQDLTYANIITALRTGKGLKLTIEVDPSYGKYHFDGHRACGIRLSPQESAVTNGVCRVCRQPLTIGVLNRVEALADRMEGFRPTGAHPFISLLPLSEVISLALGTSLNSKPTWAVYNQLVEGLNNEYNILLNASKLEIERFASPDVTNAILSDRQGQIKIEPGYDGVYGEPVYGAKKVSEKPKQTNGKQRGLDEFIKTS